MGKARNSSVQKAFNPADLQAAEHVIIKHDLLKVIGLNVIYLAGLLALFFANQKTHFLEAWFSKFMNM